jgi:ATP-dependent helicase STH1/SNF2
MGATEENDPEFARMVGIIRYYNQISKQQSGPQNQDVRLNQQQMNNLRYQVQGYKHLANNETIPPALQNAVSDAGFQDDQQIATMAQKIVASAFKKEQVPIPSNPYSYFYKPSTAADLQQRLLMPSVLPLALDPVLLREERERFIRAKVENRIQELSNLQNNISNNSDLKLKAMIELKSLKLLEKQRALRTELLMSASKATTLSTAIDRSSFRRMKKQSLREARQTEKQERALRGEKERRERQKHLDYLNSILTHGRDFINYHRQHAGKNAKLGSAIMRFHSAALKEEERRLQRHSQERLNALKANDEEAYMKLLDKTKDTRITTILNQTNAFLATLTSAVEKQKQSISDGDLQAADEEADDDETPKDYYQTAHKINEIVTEQSSLLVGGTLKDYQIKGLQWMVSLYNNRLNGILADEMGLGKTIQTLSLITYLIEKKKQPGPFLVIVPLSTMTNWVLEFEKWAPSVVKIVYKGSREQRRNLHNTVRMGNFNVLLTTYEFIINPLDRPVLSKVKWVHMIIDEGHRMKNANSKLSVTLMQFYSARYRLILTGTPLQVY